MKRKKIGSTLITVVIICSAVLITGTAFASMTLGDYKMKQLQSNRTHNLYGADSGLDAAYDVMVADFDTAGNYAGLKVQQLKAGNNKFTENQDKYKALDEEEQNLEKENISAYCYEVERKRIQKNKDILINAEFQRSFKLFLNSDWAKSYTNESPNQFNNLNITNNGKEKTKISYVDKINASDTGISFVNKSVEINGNPTIRIEPSVITVDNKSVDVLNIDEVDIPDGGTASPNNYTVKQCAEIKISSTFKTNKGENGEAAVGVNERTVESAYNIVIPNYDDIYFTEQQYKPYIYNAYKNKAITVFGNMQLKDMGTNKFTVSDGDVFVLGNKNNLPNSDSTPGTKNVSSPHVIEKYKGGISLDGNSTAQTQIEFKKDVFTGGTFNIQKNVNVTLDQNLYALNVYAGKQNGEAGDKSDLNIGSSMIIDNDLTLKSTDTRITMQNFYGINDKDVKDLDSNKDRNSSSILVNTYKDDNNDKKSSVNISKEAYIMGVAYIDTDTPYQTGESVGVKGNYNAYSQEAVADKGKFTFGANNPLYLINGKVKDNGTVDENVTVDDKQKHFFNFWYDDKNNKALDTMDTGGVTLPKAISNIYSAGAIVYTDENGVKQVRGSNYNLDNTTILGKQRSFALNVYNMGEDPIIPKDSNKTKEQILDDLYNIPYDRGTFIGNFMTLSNVPDDKTGQIIPNDGKNIGLFNKDSTKKVIIRGIDFQYPKNDKDIFIDVESGELSAFIATAGDLIIDGKVNIKGNIIVQENLIVQGTGDKTITYDETVAQSIQRKVPNIFANVFNHGESINDTTSPDVSNLKIDYDLGKFLKNLLWKIKK